MTAGGPEFGCCERGPLGVDRRPSEWVYDGAMKTFSLLCGFFCALVCVSAPESAFGQGRRSEGAGKPPRASILAAQWVVPKIEFREASLSEAVEFLRVKSRELDPAKVGVNILLGPGAQAMREKPITLSLQNIPLSEALRYVAELAGLQVREEAPALVLEPPVRVPAR